MNFHDSACSLASASVAKIVEKIERVRAACNVNELLQYDLGRYYWPAMDRMIRERDIAWMKAAIAAGADPARLCRI
jgi:hypothetical protein